MRLMSLLFLMCLLACNDSNRSKNKSVSQSFKELIGIDNRSDTILFVCMDLKQKEWLKEVQSFAGNYYQRPIKSINMQLPKGLYHTLRKRFKADALIKYLDTINQGRYKFVVGLCDADISTIKGSNKDWGVFGLGSLDHTACVISTFRLKRGASGEKLSLRLKKVVVHELGHNHGIRHCESGEPCFMVEAAGKISTIDNEPLDMCNTCKKKK